MNLNSMTFAPNDNGDVYPDTVTVTMTIAEAALITRIVGKLNDLQSEEIVPVRYGVHRGIYSCLSVNVFNPYYDGGISDYMP